MSQMRMICLQETTDDTHPGLADTLDFADWASMMQVYQADQKLSPKAGLNASTSKPGQKS